MIFTVRDTQTGLHKSLVCLRLYESTSRVDCLTIAGCNSLMLSNKYKVMLLGSLVRRVYIIPDFCANESGVSAYHVCKWKWNRSPAME